MRSGTFLGNERWGTWWPAPWCCWIKWTTWGGGWITVESRVHNLEQVTISLMGCQDKFNDKVNILSFDWNLNLKYHVQVVDFELKMLSFSLNKLVLVHKDWTQQNSLVQEQFGLCQDWIAVMEETLRSLKTKVRVSSSKLVLALAEEPLLGFRSWEELGLCQPEDEGCQGEGQGGLGSYQVISGI